MRLGIRIVALALICSLAALLAVAQADDPAPRPRIDRVLVPAGAFTMGADEGGEADERPAHRVEVRAFAIDRLEVSNEDYASCVAAERCRSPRRFGPEPLGARKPVVGVSWFDAGAYCAWAAGRLPTEAEWEKAARGGDARRFPWGDEPVPDDAHATFGSRHRGPTDVGTKPAGAGPYGALDQAGNVWEWVSDVYGPTYYRDAPAANPTGPTCDEAVRVYARLRAQGLEGLTGTNPLPTTCERVLRGGAWNYGGPGLRTTNRVHHPPTFRIRYSGFRCAGDPQ
ncbi:MAG: SUMF1/EgtB/PvdO family nonheme iron enzyme [Deltaproteobacteria bacterium]|nr:SUMF1/EgtB/PvdO family nonheme iron enzyme [Deltaproteobacteria bacterium]